MRVRVSRERSRFVPLKEIGVLGSVLLVAAVAVGMALASVTEIKRYDATISAPARSSATSQAYTFTLTNDASSNQTIGSANVKVPLGYEDLASFSQLIFRPAADGTWVSAGKSWKAPVYNSATRTIELRTLDSKNSLAAGERLRLTFSATAACGVPLQWPTHVKQSNNFLGSGNDFTGPSPILSVTGATKFTFSTISDAAISDQVVGREFEVKIRATDGCPETVPFTGKRKIRGLTGVADQEVTFTNGLATAKLTPVHTQAAARLRVVDGSDTAITVADPSNAFDVVQVLCEYDPDDDTPCEAQDREGKVTLTTPRPPLGATIGFSFGALGNGSTCAGSPFTSRGPVANVDPKYPKDYDGPALSFVGRWNKSEVPGTGVANFLFCMSKDGLAYEIVPSCTKSGELPGSFPYCELHRSRNGVGDLIIRFLIAPDDPFVGLG
jgi:hypothetical protein